MVRGIEMVGETDGRPDEVGSDDRLGVTLGRTDEVGLGDTLGRPDDVACMFGVGQLVDQPVDDLDDFPDFDFDDLLFAASRESADAFDAQLPSHERDRRGVPTWTCGFDRGAGKALNCSP